MSIERVIERRPAQNSLVARYELTEVDWRMAFRGITAAKLASGPIPTMSFGPSLCDVDTALKEGFIKHSDEFVPHLESFGQKKPVRLFDHDFTLVSGLVPTEGHSKRHWLGDISFSHTREEGMNNPRVNVKLIAPFIMETVIRPLGLAENISDREIVDNISGAVDLLSQT